MKKILLATTILVGSAGIAAADVSFSGSAFMGIESSNGGAAWTPKVTGELDVAMSGETDGGLAFGADFTLVASGYTGGTTTPTDENVNGVSVWMSGDFGKVSLASDQDASEVTLGYEHTFGDFGVELNYEFTAPAWDIEVSYDFGDYDVYLNHNSAGVTGLGGNAAFGDFSLGLDIANVSLASTTWEVTAGWSSGAISVDATVGAGNTWELEGAYDLGGGASVEAAFDDAGNYSLGVAMEF